MLLHLAVGVQAGWDLLERLVKESATQRTPVVVFSTDPKKLEEVRSQPERFGGQRLVRKPLDLDEVLQAVHELIGKA